MILSKRPGLFYFPQTYNANRLEETLCYIALSALYADDPSNTWVIEKLVLAMIKAFSAEKAETWVEDHNTQLRGYSFPIDSETMMQLINTFGSDQGPIVASLLSTTMYDRCKSIIQTMGIGSGYKPLYTDFETAKEYYEQHGVVKGTTKEVADFNDLMEFVYIGRRTKEKEIENVSEENYIISQIMIIPPGIMDFGNA